MPKSIWNFFICLLLLLVSFQFIYYFSQIGTPKVCPKQESIPESPIPAKIDFKNARKKKIKAAIVILARNTDLRGLQKTIPIFENRFNKRFSYPYVFLNDVPFTETFKTEIKKLTNSQLNFGTIPKEQWSYPSWINITRADEARQDMERRRIIYGGSLSYRHMCRYNSGFFFRHPLLKDFEYYWRVEPNVEFYCDVEYDPFRFMKENNKKYGFVIMLHEYWETIPTLWKTTQDFIAKHSNLLSNENSFDLIRRSDGTYNGCHFWSNFEIASLDFLRSEKYLTYFEYLDKEGGFFYERWGDAPVHSIAAAMFLPIKDIHYFADIGYFHGPFYNCPSNPALQLKCDCNPAKNVNNDHECFRIYQKVLRYSGR